MEVYGEDLEFKQTEMATFTVQMASIRLQNQEDKTIPVEVTKREKVMNDCQKLQSLNFGQILDETNKLLVSTVE